MKVKVKWFKLLIIKDLSLHVQDSCFNHSLYFRNDHLRSW